MVLRGNFTIKIIMKKLVPIIFLLLGYACATGASTPADEAVQPLPGQNLRTSSDMNITPAANTVPDGPEPKPADTLKPNE